MHSLSILSVKKELSLTHLHSSLGDQNKLSKMCQLDTTVAVKVLCPTLKVTLIHDMLKDEGKRTDPLCTSPSCCGSKDDEKHQEMLYADDDMLNSEKKTQSLGFYTLEVTEDGLSKLLQVLPAECTVCTEFMMSVCSLNFTKKQYEQACSLPVNTVDKICLMHFCQANEILKLPLKEANDMNESHYKDLHDHFSKAKMCMKYIPAFGLRKIGNNVADSMQAVTNNLCQLCDLLYCGE